MCGIAGVISRRGNPGNFHLVKNMCNLLRHRGPDDEGYVGFYDKNKYAVLRAQDSAEKRSDIRYLNYTHELHDFTAVLGHRRLSIIDLSSSAHNPMSTIDGNYWISYNGEVYNYLELRKELEGLGHKFLSKSDTEVVLVAFAQWGINCLKRFNGMWAFVIYDVEKQKLFASRDRFGVKPFYYSFSDSEFSFASEQKALVESGAITKNINDKAVFDFLTELKFEHEEDGFFKGVYELFPGTALELDITGWKLKRTKYYDLPFNNGTSYQIKNEVDIIYKIRSFLNDAIKLRMRSDVPLGLSVSGGIDSSALAGLTTTQSKTRLHAFTAGSELLDLDETRYARLVSTQNNMNYHEVVPSVDELSLDLETLIYSQDIPLFSTSTYAQHRVMKLAKEHNIKVLLDGQGGDELFAGYSPHHFFHGLDFCKNFNISALIQEFGGLYPLTTRTVPAFKQFAKFFILPKMPYALKKQRFKEYRYISEELVESNKNQHNDLPPLGLNSYLKHEYQTRLKGYLKCEDRCSMWHSIESRTPFSDDINLIEGVFQIPGHFKIQNGVSKYLLREAVKDLLPAEVYERKDKMGYLTANNLWISNLAPHSKDYFTADLKPYLNIERLKKDYDNYFNQPTQPENGRMFKFLSFAIWHQVYFK